MFRTFAPAGPPWLAKLRRAGYQVHLVFLSPPNAEAALARVAERVRLGGHAVPDDVVRRRFAAGLRNFFSLYLPLASTWRMYDNSRIGQPRLVARGTGEMKRVVDSAAWARISGAVRK